MKCIENVFYDYKTKLIEDSQIWYTCSYYNIILSWYTFQISKLSQIEDNNNNVIPKVCINGKQYFEY